VAVWLISQQGFFRLYNNWLYNRIEYCVTSILDTVLPGTLSIFALPIKINPNEQKPHTVVVSK